MTVPITELRLDDLNGRKVLVLWSGGLDSTSLLFRLLAETEAKVYTHFVARGEGAPEATPAAKAAIRAQRASLQAHVRDWPHSESQTDGRRLKFPDSVLPHRFAHALVYLEHAACAAVSHGLAARDYVLMGLSSDGDAPLGSWVDRAIARLRERAIAYAYNPDPAPGFTTLNPPPTRAEALAALPEDLREMVTSCPKPVADPGSPIGWRDCLTCPDCDRLASIGRLA